MTRSTVARAAVFALVVAFVPPAIAASPQTKCKVTKINAATQKLASKLKCYANAMKKSVPLDPNCLLKVDQKFATVFAKVEAKTKGGCTVTGEGPTVETQVDKTFSNLVADEPDAAVCSPNGSFCIDSNRCCPGLTCKFNDLQMVTTCSP